MNKKLYELLETCMRDGGESAPFLCIGGTLEILHASLEQFLTEKVKEYGGDAQSIFRLSDDGDSLKIDTVKSFLAHGDTKPRHNFQVFVIENISRMTSQAQNACLKFFEEPGKGNIIILTNSSENGILDTIISRSYIYYLGSTKKNESGAFYTQLIENYIDRGDRNLISYFFTNKLEKQEYLDFLTTLLHFLLLHHSHTHLLSELEEDISGILKNNFSARYIVDKYIMEL